MPEVTGNPGELTPAVGSASSDQLGAEHRNRVLTLHIEIPNDEDAESGFQQMLDECGEQVISADRETLTIRLRHR